MDLMESTFEYTNDVQFVQAMHKCIDFLNMTTTYNKRVPYEMIIGQAVLETGLMNLDLPTVQIIYLILELFHLKYHTLLEGIKSGSGGV